MRCSARTAFESRPRLRQFRCPRVQFTLLRIKTNCQQLGLQASLVLLQFLVALGLAGLALEMLDLLVDLVAKVVQPVQVVAGMANAVLGLPAALLVLRNAGCFLDITRISSGLASISRDTMPCSIMA